MANRKGSSRIGRGPVEKVPESVKRDIMYFYQTGLPLRMIADKFGVSESYPSQLAARLKVKRGILPGNLDEIAAITKALAEAVVEGKEASFPVPDSMTVKDAARRALAAVKYLTSDEDSPNSRPKLVERAKPAVQRPIGSHEEIRRLAARGVGRTGIAAMLRCRYSEIDAALARR